MTAVLAYLLLGLLAGSAGAALLRGRPAPSWAPAVVLGVVGALLGGFVGGLLLDVRYGAGVSLLGLVSAAAGSFVLLVTYGLVLRRGSVGSPPVEPPARGHAGVEPRDDGRPA